MAKDLKREAQEGGHPVLPWMLSVRAMVLKQNTPVHVRETCAGNTQFQQGSVEAFPVSAAFRFMLKERERNPDAPVRQICEMAIQKTAQPRQRDKVMCNACFL